MKYINILSAVDYDLEWVNEGYIIGRATFKIGIYDYILEIARAPFPNLFENGGMLNDCLQMQFIIDKIDGEGVNKDPSYQTKLKIRDIIPLLTTVRDIFKVVLKKKKFKYFGFMTLNRKLLKLYKKYFNKIGDFEFKTQRFGDQEVTLLRKK